MSIELTESMREKAKQKIHQLGMTEIFHLNLSKLGFMELIDLETALIELESARKRKLRKIAEREKGLEQIKNKLKARRT